MTKKEIIEFVTAQMKQSGFSIKKNHITTIVECVFDVFIDQLAETGRIEIRDFGTFKVKHTPARIGRNPVTKEEADIPARNIIQFKAGKMMKEIVAKSIEQ